MVKQLCYMLVAFVLVSVLHAAPADLTPDMAAPVPAKGPTAMGVIRCINGIGPVKDHLLVE